MKRRINYEAMVQSCLIDLTLPLICLNDVERCYLLIKPNIIMVSTEIGNILRNIIFPIFIKVQMENLQ